MRQTYTSNSHRLHLCNLIGRRPGYEVFGTETLESGRHYKTQFGLYPSVTTFTGSLDSGWVDEWRAKVGKEKADRISKLASERGSALHQLCEDYISGKTISNVNPIAQYTWKSIRPSLERIGDFFLMEEALVSHQLHLAGRCDLIAMFDDQVSVVDYKTSTRKKTADDVLGYWLQTCAYSMMAEEMFIDFKVPNLTLIISYEDGSPADVYTKSSSDFRGILLEEVDKFHLNRGDS